MAPGWNKRSLFGLVAGAVMSLALVAPAPAVAETGGGTVTVSGTNNAQLVFTFGSANTASVAFGAVDPLGTADPGDNVLLSSDIAGSGSCYRATQTVTFSVQSNRAYTGTVSGASGTSTPVGSLHWAHGSTAATCTSSAVGTTAASWIGTNNPNAGAGIPTSGFSFTDSYALQVNWTDTVNPSFTLTYAVSQ